MNYLVTLLAALGPVVASANLEDGFKAPPNSAKPHTWFHMMNGNVTKEGITRDFEELARVGIGGVQMFDAGCEIPPGGLDFNTPEWFEMFRHAASEARRLGLEICIPNCSGWSSSGGPWNPPANGMKQTTFRKLTTKGPAKFCAKLDREKKDHGFYADIGVFAFPTPAAEKVTFDGVKTTVDANGCTLTSDTAFDIAGFSYRLTHDWAWDADADITVEASEDGLTFKPVEKFRVALMRAGQTDSSFRFRALPRKMTLKALRVKKSWSSVKAALAEARPEARVELSNLKAKTFGVRMLTTPDAVETMPDQVVPKKAVRDLTRLMAADGTLMWDVPAGEWTILRIGYLCNGSINHPASDHGCGLEVDKLSAEAMDFHFEQYVSRLCRTLGPLAGNVETGLNNILVDSYEVGSQNWTQKMESEFKRRRGYSLRPFMPVFAGYIVNDVETTERFLEDFRRVVADLFAENYAGALAKKCHEYGLQCSIEPYGSCPSDNLQYGQYCDIPMGEFWSHAGNPYGLDVGNSKFISYIAHVWGRKYCATESFTASPGPNSGRWMTTPFSIKAQGDSAYAQGVNRIIYHRFTHQPWADDKYLPGMTMGRWGMHLDRTQTWWEFSKPWFRYQTRCQYMLQQGTFCADVLFFAGEQAPNHGKNIDGGSASEAFYNLPVGYDSDICPADAMYQLKVENGFVVVPGGVKYRILAMPPMNACSPKMVACVARLREAGATVVWPKKPVRAPGLKWGRNGDAKVRSAADALWAKGVLECTAAAALERLNVAPDCRVESTGAKDIKRIEWLHRRDASADWYFTAMPNRQEATAELSFRQTGRIPELWDAETGVCAPADVWREEDGRTYVTIPYTVCGSKFVVFRKPISAGVSRPGVVSCEVTANRRPDPIVADSVKHTLVIKAAKYGVVEKRLVDITKRLAARMKGGEISVKVDNYLAGCDPACRTEKKLYLTYEYDGVEKKLVVNENQMLLIPQGATKAVPTQDGEWMNGAFYAWQPLTVKMKGRDGAVRTLKANPPPAIPVTGAWSVSFPNGFLPNKLARGPEEKVVFDRLGSWSENKNEGVRYFSGIATYEKELSGFEVEKLRACANARVALDLGNVKDFAEVAVNGKTYPVLWKPPFRVDITDALSSSPPLASQPLRIRVRVANLWANRLIGDDRQFADDCTWRGSVRNGVKEIGVKEIPQWVKEGRKSPTGRCTFTTRKHWDKNDELLQSGILGPVYLRVAVPVR